MIPHPNETPTRVPVSSSPRVFLLVGVVLLYVILATAYAVRIPAWLAPDEPAHFNYAAQVAQVGCCPVIEAGDWDQVYLSQLTSADFAPDLLDRLATLQYEDHQPPLYYGAAALVYQIGGGNLLLLRLLSVGIGAGVILAAYAVARAILPARPQIALAVALLVALVPQHLAMMAAVNNDGLAEMIVGVTLWRLILYVKKGDPILSWAWLLGVLVGLGMLTKVSTLFLIGLVPLGMIWAWLHQRDRSPRALALRLGAFAMPLLLISGVWWVRNLTVYGFPDFLGLAAHNTVVVGQPRTADLIAQIGMGAYLRQAVQTTFQSFWGQFGWMELPLPTWAYQLIGAFLLAALAGIGLAFVRRGDTKPKQDGQSGAWALIGLTLVLALAQFVYYNTEFLQFQGRYIYPGLIPFALFVGMGVEAWRQAVLKDRWRLVTPLMMLWLLPLNLFILWRVIPGLVPA